MNRFALPFAALSLAACSQQPTAQAPAGDSSEDSAAPAPTATVTETATATATITPSPTPSATDTAPAQSIPVAIRGRWGLVPGDCTSTRGDAKGLLVIDATTLKFYESVATLGAVSQSAPNSLRAMFDFEGEGMTWQGEVELDVEDAGATLVRTEYGENSAPDPFHYSRCP